MRTIILALLLVAPLSAHARDFLANDQVWGVNAGGDVQFWQEWTDHKVQLQNELSFYSTGDDIDVGNATGSSLSLTAKDNGYTSYVPATSGESTWTTGPNHDANGSNDDSFEIRSSVTPGQDVRMTVSPSGDVHITGDLTVDGTSPGGGGGVSLVANGTTALGTGAIGDGACATAVSSSGAGILTTDTITWSFNQDVSGVTGYNPAGDLVYIMSYPTSGNANFKVCNKSGSSVTPGAVTLNWRVVR